VALTKIDRNLLKRCLADAPGGWKDFVDRFIGLFVHVINHTAHARSVRLSQHDVDDLCAEIFLAILTDDKAILRRFRGKSSLATYLTVIARRVSVAEIARRRKAEALGHVSAHSGGSGNGAGREAGESRRVEDREEIEKLLEGLSGTDADVVRQFHLHGKSYQEISSKLGISENSIGPTLSRARAKLRRKQVKS